MFLVFWQKCPLTCGTQFLTFNGARFCLFSSGHLCSRSDFSFLRIVILELFLFRSVFSCRRTQSDSLFLLLHFAAAPSPVAMRQLRSPSEERASVRRQEANTPGARRRGGDTLCSSGAFSSSSAVLLRATCRINGSNFPSAVPSAPFVFFFGFSRGLCSPVQPERSCFSDFFLQLRRTGSASCHPRAWQTPERGPARRVTVKWQRNVTVQSVESGDRQCSEGMEYKAWLLPPVLLSSSPGLVLLYRNYFSLLCFFFPGSDRTEPPVFRPAILR